MSCTNYYRKYSQILRLTPNLRQHTGFKKDVDHETIVWRIIYKLAGIEEYLEIKICRINY